jgi:type IV secretory pathway VirB4 component
MHALSALRSPGALLHRATTAHLQSVYPGICEGRGFSGGVYIGRDLHGGSFTYDPWELYAAGLLTNPNMLVLGQLGLGKSALVKTYVFRQLVFGRQALMLDPKGENGPLCAACDVAPVVLRPDTEGGGVRLNPLDLGAGIDPHTRLMERMRILGAICGASLGRPLTPEERLALELATGDATPRSRWDIAPTLRAVVEALLHPTAEAAEAASTTQDQLAAASRTIALELRRLVDGDLCGMFDGETSAAIDLTAPLVSFDLSAVYGSSALPILMACVGAWFQGVLAGDPSTKRIVVLDEAWALLSNLETAQWLRASYKLARSHGVQYLAVLHRLTDLEAAGSADSAQVRLARGLISDTETVVIYGQHAGEIPATRELLQLNDEEARAITRLGRGVALWRVGSRSSLVRHWISAQERAICDSDQRMRENPREFGESEGSAR